MATPAFYEKVLSHFPQKYMRMAFAYGSGVFQQHGHTDMSKNIVDFIFVVDDSTEWHRENIEQNRKHYSFLKYFGANRVSWVQEKFGARVYFNTLVPCENRMIKYGVISSDALRSDLLDWESLYVSGRLHKPVYNIIKNQAHDFELALQTNRKSALHTSLLMLPDQFKEDELFEKITELSYLGDLRMTFGEDKNKVKNIVKTNVERFRELYEPFILKEDHLDWIQKECILEQSLCPESRIHHLNMLPKALTDRLVATQNAGRGHRDTEEILRALAHDCRCRHLVRECVSSIVKRTSTLQAIKGIFTGGFTKSAQYSLQKIKKMRKSQKTS